MLRGSQAAFRLDSCVCGLPGLWVGDCFVYNNSAWRLNYCVGGEVTVMYHLDRPMYLLGYLMKEAKVYLVDRDFGIMGYTLNLAMIEYKTLVIRGDLEAAQATLARVPKVGHLCTAQRCRCGVELPTPGLHLKSADWCVRALALSCERLCFVGKWKAELMNANHRQGVLWEM